MDGTILEKVKKYAEVVQAHIPVSMIVLYGSYARGVEKEYSDIDVAVVAKVKEGSFLATSADLFKFTADIDARIEPILLAENSSFLRSILSYGIVIFDTKRSRSLAHA